LQKLSHVDVLCAEANELRLHARCYAGMYIAVVSFYVAVDLVEERGDPALNFVLVSCGGQDASEDIGLLDWWRRNSSGDGCL
jgi:hypothetical protein